MASEKSAISPWHMWGGSQTVTVSTFSIAGPAQSPDVEQAIQLSMIQYRRPETWSFFFSAVLFAATGSRIDSVATACFDLTLGVGRSQIIIPNFRTFRIDHMLVAQANGFDHGKPLTFWSAVSDPPLIGWTTDPGSGEPLKIFGDPVTELCSESIQVSGRLRVQINDFSNVPPMSVSMQLHSYFAPKTHVRPEWFGNEERGFYGKGSSIPRFPGGEDRGT
jgi:hypothetical protein